MGVRLTAQVCTDDPAFEPINDIIHYFPGGVAGACTRGGIVHNFPDKIFLKVWHAGHQQSGFLFVGQATNNPPGAFPAIYQPQKTGKWLGGINTPYPPPPPLLN